MVLHLFTFIVALFWAIPFLIIGCPQGTYLQDSECLNCSDSCLKCVSVSQCIQCRPQRGLYQGKCVKTCPETTFPVFNDIMSHIDCKEPMKVIDGAQSHIIIPYKEPIRLSESEMHLIHVKNLREDIQDWVLSGWFRQDVENITQTSDMLEVYLNAKTFYFGLSQGDSLIPVQGTIPVDLILKWEDGIWRRFSLKITIRADANRIESFFMLLGGMKRRFLGSVKGLIFIPNSNVGVYKPFGGVEKLLTGLTFITQNVTKKESLEINRNKTYQFEFNIDGHITLVFSIKLQYLDLGFIYRGCTILEIIDQNSRSIMSFRLLNKDRVFEICSTTCHKFQLDSPISDFGLELIYHADISQLLVNFVDIYKFETYFAGGKLSFILGGTRRDSCSFIPFNILLFEGEFGGYRDANEENCLLREGMRGICLKCPDNVLYDPLTGNCSKQPSKYLASLLPGRLPFCKNNELNVCRKCFLGYHPNRYGDCVLDCLENQYSFPISNEEYEIGRASCRERV